MLPNTRCTSRPAGIVNGPLVSAERWTDEDESAEAMQPLFTLHAGEYLVGAHIERVGLPESSA